MKNLATMTEQEVRQALYDILWAIEQLPLEVQERLWVVASLQDKELELEVAIAEGRLDACDE